MTAPEPPSGLGAIRYEQGDDFVATITLNRPERMNAFDQHMLDEFERVWNHVRVDDRVRAVVLQAAGDRAFCTGVDVKAGLDHPDNIWSRRDPGTVLGPKAMGVWKPVVAAVHGMAAGGAFYWLNEADVILCSPDATFFDPHVSYGMVAALEPIGLVFRVGLGEALRIALTGLDERVSAARGREIGLVSEIVPRDELGAAAHELAASMAAKDPGAVQGTVRAIWESLDVGRAAALQRGLSYTSIGSPLGIRARDGATAERPRPRVR